MRALDRPECRTLSIPQAAAVLGVSSTTLYDVLRRDGIPELGVRRIGRQWRVSKVMLERYLAGETVAS